MLNRWTAGYDSETEIDTAIGHLERLGRPQGWRTATRNFGPKPITILKGIPRSSKVKVAVNETEDPTVVKQLLRDFVDQVEEREAKRISAQG